MENIFRKYGWAVRLGVIAVACLLLAMAINAFVASKLVPYTVPAPQEVAAKGAQKKTFTAPATRAVNRVLAIQKRCLFECEEEEAPVATVCEPECLPTERCEAGVCVPSAEALPVVDSDVPLPSDMNAKLVGVMVSSKPEWSTAIIQDPATRQAYILRPEDMVLGQATLLEVRRDRIIIERNGVREYIRLENTITGNPTSATARSAPLGRPSSATPQASSTGARVPMARGARAQEAAREPEVKKVGDSRFQVDRKTLDAKLQDRAALAKGATPIPNYKNGKKAGLKIMNIQSDSVYNDIGLQNGDVLQAVNGEKIKSQAHALELFEKFRKSSKVSIDIERNGKSQQLDYDIR